MLMLLIKGAPDILKPYLASKRDEIKRDTAFNVELAGSVAAILEHREVPTWATLMSDIINYSREIGWSDLSSKTKNKSHNFRQIDYSQEPGPTGHPSRKQRCWEEVYNQALSLGIPKAPIQRQTIGVIQSLIDAFLRRDGNNQRENTLNIQTPTPASD